MVEGSYQDAAVVVLGVEDMLKGGFGSLAEEDTAHNRAFAGLSAVPDHTCEHVDRDSVRMLLMRGNLIVECGILVDMAAAYALLPSGLEVLSFQVSKTLHSASASRDLKDWDFPYLMKSTALTPACRKD